MIQCTGLYVHVPFCRVKCRFCHFATFPGLLNDIPAYLSALETEMQLQKYRNADTVFIGGGTPSLLSEDELSCLQENLFENFCIRLNAEITMEFNPENGEQKKLRALYSAGINRLSLGLQVSQDSLLKSLGRTHNFIDFLRAYDRARNAGFKNINIDLMFGLPGQTLRNWEETLDLVLALCPEHISGYSFDREEPSAMAIQFSKNDDDLEADMYELLSEKLTTAGYLHYEISNFSKPGFECRHNLKYWRNDPVQGLGVSAAGFDGRTRTKNHDRLSSYMKEIHQQIRPLMEETKLPMIEHLAESLMLALRLKEGVRTTKEITRHFGGILQKYRELGFLELTDQNRRMMLNLKGWLLSSQIFRELILSSR